MKATAELKMLPVSVLKPAAYNPRKKLKPGDKEYPDRLRRNRPCVPRHRAGPEVRGCDREALYRTQRGSLR